MFLLSGELNQASRTSFGFHVRTLGDGICDAGQHGIDLNCPEFSCDGGDCRDCAAREKKPDACFLGLGIHHEPYWILGDVFLRRTFVAFDDGPAGARVGLARE